MGNPSGIYPLDCMMFNGKPMTKWVSHGQPNFKKPGTTVMAKDPTTQQNGGFLSHGGFPSHHACFNTNSWLSMTWMIWGEQKKHDICVTNGSKTPLLPVCCRRPCAPERLPVSSGHKSWCLSHLNQSCPSHITSGCFFPVVGHVATSVQKSPKQFNRASKNR